MSIDPRRSRLPIRVLAAGGHSAADRTAPRWSGPKKTSGQVPLSIFEPAYLSRYHNLGVNPRALTFAAIDLATTGLNPGRDRICEIAVVRFRGDGTELGEYATVVDPQRPMGATEFHGLEGSDVKGAPTFAEVLPDLMRLLSNAIVVAHNLLFVDMFLKAEFGRTGQVAPRWPGLCTLVTTQAQLDGPAYSLRSLHRTFTGEWITDAHTALSDCRATTTLLTQLIDRSPSPLRYLGPPMSDAPDLADTPAGRIAARAPSMSAPEGLLASMARRFPLTELDHPTVTGPAQEYEQTLALALDAGRITWDTAWTLARLAQGAGMDQAFLHRTNLLAWRHMLHTAPDPASWSEGRRHDVARLATHLGLVEHARSLSHGLPTPAVREPWESALKGWRLGFDDTPELSGLKDLALRHGASIAKRLTETVRMFVTADLAGRSSSAAKAHELGIRTVSPTEAERELRSGIEAAAQKERQLAEQQAALEEQRAAESAEREAYFTHAWRAHEQDPQWGQDSGIATIKLH
ncbi:3'-5' exonuclease [Kitasatospora sp. NBC_00240]|uniref:exonuclease domain-containing protein n=1 Tax=Kitasatospora sp. NBC_00240 TaxID=2903567 RepID=UPI00225034C9|nr:exonuclease domain-containing protein [Kitasatospora sp. NBC_00240]MCX5215567.1 3'-5' exonuclease [Kitasatospora sp. NBC_00240]